jgi:hypothetical protein
VSAENPGTNNIKPGTDSGGWEPKRQTDSYGTSGGRSRCAADYKTIENRAVFISKAFGRLRKSLCEIMMFICHPFPFWILTEIISSVAKICDMCSRVFKDMSIIELYALMIIL